MLHRKTLCVLVALTIAILLTASGSESQTNETRVEYAGEPNKWGPTVSAVVLASDGSDLSVTVETDMDLQAYVAEKGGNRIVELLFDIDRDPSTGGVTYSAQNSEATGFESSSMISACKELDGGYVCAGDTDDFVGFSARFMPYVWDAETNDFDKYQGWSIRQGVSDLDGTNLTVKIPYAVIGADPGTTIRLFIFSHQFSEYPELELTLR